MNDKEQEANQTDRYVSILMQEYGTLRTEVLNRTTGTFQLLGVIGLVGLWLLSKLFEEMLSASVSWRRLIVLGLLSTVFISVFYLILRLNNGTIRLCGGRLREIEHEVNAHMRRSLLRWETYWANNLHGLYRIAQHKPYAIGDEPPRWIPQQEQSLPRRSEPEPA